MSSQAAPSLFVVEMYFACEHSCNLQNDDGSEWTGTREEAAAKAAHIMATTGAQANPWPLAQELPPARFVGYADGLACYTGVGL